ncbi:hypothetical protein [Erysipelothrix aquatica]|uniref:hypothetical protein n=1 Tax=Erysipelothrix aquatica TaxID=2683714 RepID=UPI00135BCDB5|nr:hypothetical protein [Erysipelothrix aquatica]
MKSKYTIIIGLLSAIILLLIVVIMGSGIYIFKILPEQNVAESYIETPLQTNPGKPNDSNTPTPTLDVAASASPDATSLSIDTVDAYLHDYANYRYTYKQQHGYINDYSMTEIGVSQSTNKVGKVFQVTYDRYGHKKQEFYFVGINFESNGNQLIISDLVDENDDSLHDLVDDVRDEGFIIVLKQ